MTSLCGQPACRGSPAGLERLPSDSVPGRSLGPAASKPVGPSTASLHKSNSEEVHYAVQAWSVPDLAVRHLAVTGPDAGPFLVPRPRLSTMKPDSPNTAMSGKLPVGSAPPAAWLASGLGGAVAVWPAGQRLSSCMWSAGSCWPASMMVIRDSLAACTTCYRRQIRMSERPLWHGQSLWIKQMLTRPDRASEASMSPRPLATMSVLASAARAAPGGPTPCTEGQPHWHVAC